MLPAHIHPCLVALALLITSGQLRAEPLADAARAQIGVTVSYDPAYRKLTYPNGDVPASTGVCCDVVIRSLRTAFGFDLQKEAHEDMRANFGLYPKKWGLKKPDANIDHRRVPNLQTFFRRKGWAVTPARTATGYRSGDIVTWNLGNGLAHIGVVSDLRTKAGTPFVIHNIGRGAQEEDVLFAWPITGQFRLSLTEPEVD